MYLIAAFNGSFLWSARRWRSHGRYRLEVLEEDATVWNRKCDAARALREARKNGDVARFLQQAWIIRVKIDRTAMGWEKA